MGLVQLVGDGGAAVEGDGGGVERVLRDGDEDPVLGAVHHQLEDRLGRLAGAVGEVDGLGVGRGAVPRLDEARHGVAHEAVALRLGVGPQAVARAVDHLAGGVDDVGGELDPVEQLRPLGDGQHLANPGDRALAEGLRVADVAVDDLAPGPLQLLGPGHDGAAHGVLGVADLLRDVFQPKDHGAGAPGAGLRGRGLYQSRPPYPTCASESRPAHRPASASRAAACSGRARDGSASTRAKASSRASSRMASSR